VFLTLSTVSSSANLAGLFHPATAYVIRASGVFPPDQATWLITISSPLDVFRKPPTEKLPSQSQLPTPRLQGFTPAGNPLSRTERLNPGQTRSPLTLSLPQAFLYSPWLRLHGASAHDLLKLALAVSEFVGLQRIESE